MSEICKAWIEFIAAFLGVVGTVFAAYGTYLITQWYHAFSLIDFLGSATLVAWYFVTFRREKALAEASRGGELSPNQERKEVSLSGIYLVAVGFVLQMVSAVLILTDATSYLLTKL
ncbi:MAG TPA: hypothetical protein VEI26_05240 [Terriglobales bacterium]|nr:hypothetical protein [Terriglobales bacterium]